jgi:predicted unusual protein kinase regulating ubiquinone biosynthesis (AarF/ABC1/UbiB family)
MKPAERAERERRAQVEACLARWDLLRRPRRLEEARELGPQGAALGRRLRGALAELGPVFSAFGVYLASRVDLVAAADALELASLPEGVSPLAADAVHERLTAELGREAAETYAFLEAEPFESRLLLQSHRGRLASGEAVIVRLVRTDAEPAIASDRELLPLISEALEAQGWTAAAVQDALAGFRDELREQLDLRAAVQDLDLLAADAETFGRLVTPAVFRDLTTARLVTTADLRGVALSEAAEPRELARSLCTVWLRQALAGRAFPIELRGEDVRALPDGRIGFQGIALARTTAAAQAAYREALVAVAFRDPDAAAAALLPLLARESDANSLEELRMHLRQLVPFRDGSWSLGGESLAEHFFLYARTARRCGYRARRPLLELCRGLFAAGVVGRRLAPERDALFEGLQDARMLAGVSQVREALSFESWGGQLDRYALLLAALPQRLDEMLTLAAEGSLRPAPPAEGPPQRAESSHLVLAAALMVLAAVALLAHRFVQMGALGGRGEVVAGVLFVCIGGVLLWILTRTG